MSEKIKVLPQSEMQHYRLIKKFGTGEIFELIDPSFPDPVIVSRGRVLQPEALQAYLDRRKTTHE